MTQITLPLAPHLCPDKTRKNATNTKVLKRRKTLSNEWSALICTKLLVLGIKGTQAEPSDTNKRIALPGKCSAVTFPHSCLCIVHWVFAFWKLRIIYLFCVFWHAHYDVQQEPSEVWWSWRRCSGVFLRPGKAASFSEDRMFKHGRQSCMLLNLLSFSSQHLLQRLRVCKESLYSLCGSELTKWPNVSVREWEEVDK